MVARIGQMPIMAWLQHLTAWSSDALTGAATAYLCLVHDGITITNELKGELLFGLHDFCSIFPAGVTAGAFVVAD